MKLTYKAIARNAGYYTYESAGRYAWRNWNGWIDEVSGFTFGTEEDAYEDCCESAGLCTAGLVAGEDV